MTPPPTKITEPGSSRSLSISSEVIMCSAPGIGSWRGFDPAEIVRFDHRDRHSSASDRTGNANAGVAASKDHHVEFFGSHSNLPRLLVITGEPGKAAFIAAA